MSSIAKVKGDMEVTVAISSDGNLGKLTEDQEARFLLAAELAINSMPPIKFDLNTPDEKLENCNLSLRVHMRKQNG